MHMSNSQICTVSHVCERDDKDREASDESHSQKKELATL